MASEMSYEKVVKEIDRINLGEEYRQQVMEAMEELYKVTKDIYSVGSYVRAIQKAAEGGELERFIASGAYKKFQELLLRHPISRWRPTRDPADTYVGVFKEWGEEGIKVFTYWLVRAIELYHKCKKKGILCNPDYVIEIFDSGIERGEFLAKIEDKVKRYIEKEEMVIDIIESVEKLERLVKLLKEGKKEK